MKITIQTIINSGKKKVWEYYTDPKHIIHWNFASKDWCCPSAENDLQIGGRYKARMEAIDKSFGFDFEAIYDAVNSGESFTYTLDDGRAVNISFESTENKTKLTIIFDAEKESSEEMQRNGWQSILNNFKSYVENTNLEKNTKTLTYSIVINKPSDIVFNKIMDKSVYPEWSKAWGDGMTFQGEWKQGSNISFFDTQDGTKVVIEELNQNQSIKMRHIAMVNAELDEIELEDETMQKWIGSQENYYFKKINENETELKIVMVVDEAFQKMFDNAWPNALEYFKSVCEVQR